jgi:PleD family two-component response regulator
MILKRLHLLLVDSDPQNAALVREAVAELEEGRYWRLSMRPIELVHVESVEEAAVVLESERFDVILLSLASAGCQGLHSYLEIQALASQSPVVVLVSQEDETLGIAAIREGAQDYLLDTEMDCRPLARSLRYALERHQMAKALRQLSMRDDTTGLYSQVGFLALAERDLELLRRVGEPGALFLAEIQAAFLEAENRNLALMEVADVLRGVFRADDLLARVDHSRLGVLASGVSSIEARTLASRLRESLNRRNSRPEAGRPISVRVAVIDLDNNAAWSLDDLMSRAEQALCDND